MSEVGELELRVIVADDELQARKRLVRLLEAMPGVRVIGVHEGGEGVLAQLRSDSADVLVLDVQMPGLSGTDAHALLPEDGPYVIFATAHPEHAVAAFDLGAVDYVLKPIDPARLTKAIERARGNILGRRSGSSPMPQDDEAPIRLPRIPVATRQGIVLVDPEDIGHAEFDGTLVSLHRLQGETLLLDMSLQDLVARLPSDTFERVHRRAILNLRAVVMLEPQPTGGYVAITKTGARVSVSRQCARRLRRWLGISKE